ncbi:acetyl-CoA synthetase-like protein, partial [Aureobasidium melanogenum]
MASSSIIQSTAFPRLDDLWTPIQREHNDQTAYKRLDFSFSSNQKACPRGKDDLLKSYSQFIASYTGQSEITFQTLDANAVSGPDMTDDYVLDLVQHSQHQEDTKTFDFGLEIIADVDNFESTEAPVILSCPFLVQYHAMEMALTLKYDNLLMGEDYADAIFKMLVNHISRMQVYSDQETRLSILNNPPWQRPSRLQGPHSDKDATSLLHSGFLGTLREYPDRHALDYRSVTTQFTMTYRQLDMITTALAHKLRSSILYMSHNAQLIVPAYLEASPALFISWLAVLKAGFVFCPLPVGASAIELQSIVQDICATVVLTDGPMLCGRPWDPWYCDGDDLTVCLDVNAFVTDWMHTPNIPKNKTLPSIAETDLAYIIYSSSVSLGMPVGVKMTHSAAASTTASYSKQIPSHMTLYTSQQHRTGYFYLLCLFHD